MHATRSPLQDLLAQLAAALAMQQLRVKSEYATIGEHHHIDILAQAKHYRAQTVYEITSAQQ